MNELPTPEDDFESTEPKGAFLPLALLGVSFALLLIFQIFGGLLPQRDILQKIIKQNEKGVEQSRQVQADLTKLIGEFNEAAPEETKAVFAKRGLQVSGIPTSAPSASPSATP